MASGTITFPKSATSGRYIQAKIEWTSELDTGAEASNVTAKIYVRKGHTTTTLTEYTSGSWYYFIAISNKTFGGYVDEMVLTSWVHIGTATVKDLPHKTDGTRTVTISGTVTAPTGTSFEGHTSYGNKNVDLDDIPAPPEITAFKCSTQYLTGTFSYTYNIKHAGLYNRATLVVSGNINNYQKTIKLGKLSEGKHTSTVTFSSTELAAMYEKFWNEDEFNVYIKLAAYQTSNYSLQVGATQKSATIRVSLPQNIKPTASLGVTLVNDNAWIKGKNVYVASYSKAKLALTASPGTGANLRNTSISGDEFFVEGTSTTISFASGGTYTFTGTATDTRGRSTESSRTITVLPYHPPKTTSLQITRGTYSNGWTDDENGKDVKITFAVALELVDLGNVYKVAFKIDGDSVTPIGTTSGLKSETEYSVYLKNIENESSHDLAMVFTDSVGQRANPETTVPTTSVTMEFNDSGNGLALGKTSERDGFECEWPAYFNDNLYVMTKICCRNDYSLRDFNIQAYWKDGGLHDVVARLKDGVTTRLGWSGSGDDGTEYDTVLDVRPKAANFRGTITAPRVRLTASNDLSGTEQTDVALRIGDDTDQHIDFDTNEIQAKQGAAEPGPLYLNLDGGDVYAKGWRIPEIQHGTITITPSAANTPTSAAITFEKKFSGTPSVVVSAVTSVPGTTVLGAAASNVTASGCNIWVTRANTTNTVVHWIATY